MVYIYCVVLKSEKSISIKTHMRACLFVPFAQAFCFNRVYAVLLWNHRHPAPNQNFAKPRWSASGTLDVFLRVKATVITNFWMVFLVKIRPLRPVSFVSLLTHKMKHTIFALFALITALDGIQYLPNSCPYVLLIFSAHFIRTVSFPRKFLAPEQRFIKIIP